MRIKGNTLIIEDKDFEDSTLNMRKQVAFKRFDKVFVPQKYAEEFEKSELFNLIKPTIAIENTYWGKVIYD